MKLRQILLLFGGMIMLFGCNKWNEPDFYIEDWVPPGKPTASQFWTIGGPFVIGKHTNGNPPDLLVSPTATTLRYIRAVVVSSDEGGNYYKSMVVQDSTGGVELELDRTGLYNTYPVGQKIVIVCNGLTSDCTPLVIGDYNNLPQMGWIYNETQVGRINSLYFDKYIIRDGMPSLNNLPKILTNTAINESERIDFFSDNDVNKLVRLEGVTFENEAIGKPLSFNHFTTDWIVNVPLPNGTIQPVTVRTSNFAKFRSMTIQNKEYNLTGILTKYRNIYQLMIRTKNDIEILASESEESVLLDFTSNPIGEGKWSIVSSIGNSPWRYRAATESMLHLGNKTNPTAMDDWFISPVITYSDLENGYLRFQHQLNVENGETESYQVYYTTATDAVFNINNWNLLDKITIFPASYGWSNHLPIKNIKANSFRIAFRYNATNPDITTYDWWIKNVEIRNK